MLFLLSLPLSLFSFSFFLSRPPSSALSLPPFLPRSFSFSFSLSLSLSLITFHATSASLSFESELEREELFLSSLPPLSSLLFSLSLSHPPSLPLPSLYLSPLSPSPLSLSLSPGESSHWLKWLWEGKFGRPKRWRGDTQLRDICEGEMEISKKWDRSVDGENGYWKKNWRKSHLRLNEKRIKTKDTMNAGKGTLTFPPSPSTMRWERESARTYLPSSRVGCEQVTSTKGKDEKKRFLIHFLQSKNKTSREREMCTRLWGREREGMGAQLPLWWVRDERRIKSEGENKGIA